MGRIDFFPGLLLVCFLLLASTPGLSQELNKPVVVTVNSGHMISAHELSMPAAARNLVSAGERKLSHDRDPEGAIKDFLSAIKKAPDYYEAYYLVGVAYLCAQKREEAESNLHRAVELSQQRYADAVIALGTVVLDRGEFSGGEKLLRHGLELNPNSWQVHYELSRFELSKGNLPVAEEMAQKARLLAPQKPAIYHLLAIIHQRQQDYSAMLNDLEAYIQLDPDSPTGVWAKQLAAQTEQLLADSQAAAAATLQK
jgi:tetratricopeptide (TPR) repeat protein